MTKKETLDERVSNAISLLAEDVIEEVVVLACKMAKHRGSRTLQKGDIRFAFEKRFNVKTPVKLHGLSDSTI